MYTDLMIINMGLSKIAASLIDRIDPPRTSTERFMANNYRQWKRSELTKRRWVFATVIAFPLSQTDYIDGDAQPYEYAVPDDCLRPIRQRGAEWQQYGRKIRSAESGLKLSYVKDVQETDFDVLFVDVLACRIALESVEYITQSNTKREAAAVAYDEAVRDAGRNNAFIRGPEVNTTDDGVYPFLTARF